MGRYDLSENKKPTGLIIAAILIVLIILLFAWMYFNKPQQSEETVIQELTLPRTEQTELDKASSSIPETQQPFENAGQQAEQNLVQPDIPLPPLNESDDLFRLEMGKLSPIFSELLTSQELIKKSLKVVNDFSQGQRIGKHMRFLRLQEPFIVEKDKQGWYIPQRSYQRYDQLAQAIASIDEDLAINIYQKIRPLMQQVFADFGYPNQYQLEDIFKKATAEIIAAPVLENRMVVARTSVSYKFADKNLEALNSVQKQMLRMGPENTRKIQKKLRALVQRLVEINTE